MRSRIVALVVKRDGRAEGVELQEDGHYIVIRRSPVLWGYIGYGSTQVRSFFALQSIVGSRACIAFAASRSVASAFGVIYFSPGLKYTTRSIMRLLQPCLQGLAIHDRPSICLPFAA